MNNFHLRLLDAYPSFHAGRRVRYTVSPHAACNRGEAPQGCASPPLAARRTPNTDAKHIRVMRGCPATIAALTYPLGHRRVLRKGSDWRRPVAPCAESFVLLDGVAALRCSVLLPLPLPLGGTALSRTSLRSCLVPTPSAQRAAAASPGSRGVACLLFFPSYRDMLAVKGLTRHKAIRVVAGDPLLFYSTFPLSAVRDPVQVKQAITPCLFTSRRFP